jgi:hypothetical protein
VYMLVLIAVYSGKKNFLGFGVAMLNLNSTSRPTLLLIRASVRVSYLRG